jgi:hypothetical protein
MKNFEKNYQNTGHDEGGETGKTGFRDGYLHVAPEKKGDSVTGVVEETPDGRLVYIRRDGQKVEVEKHEGPDLQEGAVYVKTKNMPPELRGFIAVLSALKKDALKTQSEINQAREAIGLKKEFTEKDDDTVKELQEEVVEGLVEGEGGEESAIEAIKKLQEMEHGEDSENKVKAAWNKWKRKIGKAVAIIGLLAVITASLSSDSQNRGPDNLSQGQENTEQVQENEGESGVGPDTHIYGSDIEGEVNNDHIVREGEGVTHALKRQLDKDSELANKLGYNGSLESLSEVGGAFGYIERDEVRVGEPGVGYRLVETGGEVFIEETDKDGEVIGKQKLGADFKKGEGLNKSEYNKLNT